MPTHKATPGRGRSLMELMLIGLVLLLATASGEILLAIAENGNASMHTLVLQVTLPAIGVIALLLAVGAMMGCGRISRAVLIGALFGAVSTAALELVRNIGFYEFNSMPGQLPELMGVLITNRIMEGPDLWSNIVGWADHVWNGATLGITYMLLVGGWPRGRSHWYGAGIGAVFGALIGTGFLLSPVSRATGAGIFGSIFGIKYVITVYLAHLAFGATLGLLAHRFASGYEPIWTVLLRLLPHRGDATTPAASPRAMGT